MPDRRTLRLIEASAVLLFWLQGLIVLLSRLFGVIYDAVFAATLTPIELVLTAGAVLASFVVPPLLRMRQTRVMLLVSSTAAALARALLVLDHPGLRLWTAMVLTAAGTAYAVALLHRHPSTFATAFVLGLVAAQLLRAAGNTYDLSLRSGWLPVQVVISLAICVVAWQIGSQPYGEDSVARERGGIGMFSGLTFGALLFLETSLLGFPNALARWTEADYHLVAPLLMAATLLPLLRSAEWGGFGLLVATLVAGWMSGHDFYQLAILAPMLLAQLAFISSLWKRFEPVEGGQTRLFFGMSLILFLVLNVALAFAFTYPYTLSFMRGKGDYVLLISIVILLLPTRLRRASAPQLPPGIWTAVGWGAASGAVVLTALFAMPPEASPSSDAAGHFRVATYNIHYGYDSHWRYTLDDQARTIEESDADIVLLQEVDAGRVTSYGVDHALWLGRRLGMEQVFGPALEDLSGVALLSRLPVAERSTRLLTSDLEQTAIVHAQIEPPAASGGAQVREGETTLDVFGTWLGLEPQERSRQLEDALEFIGPRTPAILGGDLNAPPGSPTYAALGEAGFQDAFSAVGLDGAPTSPSIDPRERIDFVWARDLEAKGAYVLDSVASDHRLVVAEFVLP